MSIDSTIYRQVLGHFPTGVTVITGTANDEPIGFTIGSFASVSLDPPLVGFLPMTTSDRWARIAETGSFCVNVLSAAQGDLCWQFAKGSIEQPFEGVEWTPTAHSGSPIIAGAIAWMDCTIEQVVDAGDHYFVMGRLVDLHHVDAETNPHPLLFFKGKLGGFAAH